MIKLFICPKCGWIRDGIQKSGCGMPEMRGKGADAPGEAGLCAVHEDVPAGTAGLRGKLAVYTPGSLTD